MNPIIIRVGTSVLAFAIIGYLVGFGVTQTPPSEGTPTPADPKVASMFTPFAPNAKSRVEGDTLVIESTGIPAHPTMVGITSWQQQVPIPQDFTGANAFRITLKPKLSDSPYLFGQSPLMNAVAVAANGVPIFPGLNNRGEDANLIGELDKWGGHCGRADDYHYHVAPLSLQKQAGAGNPIALSFDGFPIYGLTDPDGTTPKDLDKFGGHLGANGHYHYHASNKLPYINGGFRGVVRIVKNQVSPQPRTTPFREAGRPLRGAAITANEPVGTTGNVLTFTYEGGTYKVKSDWSKKGSVNLTWIYPDGRKFSNYYDRTARPPRPPREGQ